MRIQLFIPWTIRLLRKDETSVASIDPWATRSDSKNMGASLLEVSDGLLCGFSSYYLSWLSVTEYGTCHVTVIIIIVKMIIIIMIKVIIIKNTIIS